MDLKGVRAFCAVAEGGGFEPRGRHARHRPVGAEPAGLALEGELEGRLFHRTGRGVQLTELGVTLLPRAQAVLAEAEQLAVAARGERSSRRARSISASCRAAAQPLVSVLVSKLLADYPRIRLRVHEAYSGQVEDWVANGRVEVAVFNRYRRGAVRGAQVVARTDMMLVGPKGHAVFKHKDVPFRLLGELPICGPIRPNGLTTVMAELAARHGVAINTVLEGSGASILREAVARSGLFHDLRARSSSASWPAAPMVGRGWSSHRSSRSPGSPSARNARRRSPSAPSRGWCGRPFLRQPDG